MKTDRPERYAKQLASHLGRRCGVQEEADGTRLVFDLHTGPENRWGLLESLIGRVDTSRWRRLRRPGCRL